MVVRFQIITAGLCAFLLNGALAATPTAGVKADDLTPSGTNNFAVHASSSSSSEVTFPTFTQIVVDGNVSVQLVAVNQSDASDIVSRYAKNAQVKVTAKDNVLSITSKGGKGSSSVKAKKAVIKLPVVMLTELTVSDFAQVSGTKVSAHDLVIHAKNHAQVSLTGDGVDLKDIEASGSSKVSVKWATGSHVDINQGANSQVELAGAVDDLYLQIKDHANFDGEYCRAQRIVAQGSDFARLKVMPVESLRAFTSDYSTVYYYKTPAYITQHSTDSSAILEANTRL